MINKTIKIVIADDNRFFCDALKDSLNIHKELSVIKTFTTIQELINYTNQANFDILILDVNFKGENSLDFINDIRKSSSEFCIISLSTLNNNYIKGKAVEMGVNYFVSKDSDLSNFKKTILNCYNNYTQLSHSKSGNKITINNMVFTKRKLEILQALYHFANQKEIDLAKKLNLSISALKTHKRELFEITNTNNTPELIKFGIKNGLILN